MPAIGSPGLAVGVSWPLWFIDVEGTEPLTYAEYDVLSDPVMPSKPPSANIQQLERRLRELFPEPTAWAFEASGRVLSASFDYHSVDTDVLLAECRAAHAAIFDADHLMVFPPYDSWPVIEPQPNGE